MQEKETINNLQKEILNVIKNINVAWTNGKTEDLRKYFYRDIVIASPDFKTRLKGIDEVLKSYQEFYENSKIYDFSESDFNIEIFDNTGTADYEYHIIYQMNNKKYDGTGREIITFSNINNKWLVIWRCLTNVVDKEIN